MKLFLIKDKKGKIFGPYNEHEICFYIEEGDFKGEELFSDYPTGEWKPLSAHPVFYEKILAQLNKPDEKTHPSPSSVSIEKSDSESNSIKEEPIEPTRIVGPKVSKTDQKKKIKIKLSEEFKENVLAEEGFSDVIEMEDVQKKFFLKLKSSLKVPLLVFVISVFAFALLLFNTDQKNQNEQPVRLLSIKKSRSHLEKEGMKEKLRSAFLDYTTKGTVSYYLTAQMQYVRVLESHPDEASAYMHLCLIYLELWPFAYQDTRDRGALNKTLSSAKKHDKKKNYFNICRSVQAFIDKKFELALMILDNDLQSAPRTMVPIVFYIKAKILKSISNYKEANSYLQSIYTIQAQWVAPYLLSGRMYYEKQQYDLSANRYQKVLSLFSKHPSANLRMGILEYKYFKKIQNSERRLKTTLTDLNDWIEPDILIEAYISLANIYFRQNNKKEMIKYSNKAYALEPDHPDVMSLKSKLKDTSVFDENKIQARGLIFKGDMFVSQGDCSSAKKYFKKAYEVSNKKNALAAFKLAQCFWQSGVSGQAIRWLQRSINADGKMLPAYFLLSDYLSTLYDFESAKDILNATRSQNPSHYDLFKAYAFLSLRQKHYSSAITYAERALKFYTLDIEIYILLSKAYLALEKSNKAYYYADKAVQEDRNDIQAQIAYALTLDSANELYNTQAYFEELIKRNPSVVEYVQALGEYYFNKSEYEKALDQFQLAVQQAPKFKPAYIYLGRSYSVLSYEEGRKGDKYEKALKNFLSATLLDVSDPDPMFYLGQTHIQHENYQLAENEFEKVLRLNSNYPMIHYYIGLANFHQPQDKNWEKALTFAKTQSAKNPNHFLPYKLAGDIYLALSKGAVHDPQEVQRKYKLCAKEYQKALKHLKKSIEVSMKLMECYKGAGDLDSALQLGEQLVKEKGLSGHPELYKEIGGLFEIKEEYEKARSYYLEYFELRPGAKDKATISARINKLIQDKQNLSKSEE